MHTLDLAPPAPFVDAPRFVPLATYEAYVGRYVQHVKDVPGVRAIYQMGSTSAPGISDLDLIVVVDDPYRPADYQRLSVRKVFGDDAEARYLFIHDVSVVDTSSFERLGYLHYATNLTCLHGAPLPPPAVTPGDEPYLKLAILSDFILMRLHQFARFEQDSVFPLRGHIVRGGSVKHSIALADFLPPDPSWEALRSLIDTIRASWFETQDADQVRTMFDQAVLTFREILLRCSTYLRDHVLRFYDGQLNQHVLMLDDRKQTTFFVPEATVLEAYAGPGGRDAFAAFRGLFGKQHSTVLFPHYLYFHYLTYARTRGNTVQEVIAKKLSNTQLAFDVDPGYLAALQQRCEAIAHYNSFLRANHLGFSNGPGYPGFNLLTY